MTRRPGRSLALSLAVIALACAPRRDTSVTPIVIEASPAAVADTSTPPASKVPRVSDDPTIQKIVELGFTESQVDEHLEHLAKAIGARLTGSHRLMQAETWARDRFAAFGLQAKLEKWGDFPVGFDRGPWSGGMVAPQSAKYDFTTRAWTPGLVGAVRGKAVAYPKTVAELKKALKKDAQHFAGAWVVHPPNEELDKKVRTKIDDALFAAKIAGHVDRARDSSGKLVHTGGEHEIEWEKLPRDVHVILRGDQHDDLTKRIAAGEAVELEFAIDNQFFRGPVAQHNVVADIVGSELPNELVIVGGHIDSWDGADGAVDNATGCATTMEAARLLVAAGAKPKRTIRFMLWSGEEQGLLGSKAYVDQHPELADRTSVVLVHDGGTNFLSGLRVTPEMADDMKKVFAPVFDLSPEMPFALWYADALRKGGSDHGPFIDKGIPGFFWEQDGRADYEHSHHTQYDTLDFAIPEYQKHSAMVVAIAALGFANLDHKLDRTDSAALARRQVGADFDGTKVTKVEKNGRGAKAGMKVGDEVVAVDGEGGTRGMMFRRFMRDGTTKKVSVLRKGKRVELVVDFSDDPSEAERIARRERRKQKFGDLDYEKPFAGRAIEKPKTTETKPEETPSPAEKPAA